MFSSQQLFGIQVKVSELYLSFIILFVQIFSYLFVSKLSYLRKIEFVISNVKFVIRNIISSNCRFILNFNKSGATEGRKHKVTKLSDNPNYKSFPLSLPLYISRIVLQLNQIHCTSINAQPHFERLKTSIIFAGI